MKSCRDGREPGRVGTVFVPTRNIGHVGIKIMLTLVIVPRE